LHNGTLAGIAAKQFEMFQTCSPGQQVVGNVEHMVAVVVGQVDLQQAKAAVDGLVEPEFLHQQVHGPDASDDGGPRAIGNLIMDIRRLHDRLIASAIVLFVQTLLDLPLALFDLFSYLGAHSKTSVFWVT